ncbi:trimeric intracellular cation channel family protein [Paraburkholderia caffeinilytica]|uniref:trimeric intracellular cation channel family protein n=1 Tax=Paraburkholderia caffeinilytica TaxID=1761016 RepID=UPI003DA09A7A
MWLHIIYLIAITAEAMSGALVGIKKEFDLFGLCMVGTVTALGGGTVRDVLLGHYPLGWVAHPEYLVFTVGAALITSIMAHLVTRMRQTFLVADAIGLAAFTVIGCNVGLSLSLHPGVAVVAGMITGIIGGVLRDLLCNEAPLVLHGEFYASVTLIVGAVFMGLQKLGLAFDLAAVAAMIVGVTLRMLAVWQGWRLPKSRSAHTTIVANDSRRF